MRTLRFAKYHGLGNDFVVVEAEDLRAISAEDARWLCDRRRGVGADGVLVVLPAAGPDAAARMRVINADGSVPEMCGNGVRCVAELLRARASGQGEVLAALTLETDAGPRVCVFEEGGVSVDMGLVRVDGIVEVRAAGTTFALRRVDAGNPHAVTFSAVDEATLREVGPALSTSPAFPGGANVEFARREGDRLVVVVWERGVGPTQACGTGACAAAAAACAEGLFQNDAPIRVALPGGSLTITCSRSGRTSMRGPAELVFEGTVRLA